MIVYNVFYTSILQLICQIGVFQWSLLDKVFPCINNAVLIQHKNLNKKFELEMSCFNAKPLDSLSWIEANIADKNIRK